MANGLVADSRVDIVVCGAGTAGIQAALQLALIGLEVVVVDERSEGKSGARWCNGVLDWQFERAGLALPGAGVCRPSRGKIHMFSPDRNIRFTIDESPIVDVDMRLLVERLRLDAVQAGVRFEWNARGVKLEFDGDRPVAMNFERDGVRSKISARLFVDATGLNAVLRRQVPKLASVCPDAMPSECCSARQMVFEVASADGAQRFLDEIGAQAGDAIDHVGLAGGYSVEVISVEPDLDEVAVLVGTVADGVHGDAASMMAKVREQHEWIGKPVFGGGGVIPLRRPYAFLAVPGLALVGDAASQVMAAHGSGIGFGLMAGKVLAESVAGAQDPGSLDAVWRYQASYHREFGAILVGYDIFRRYSSNVDGDGIQALFAGELFDARLAAPGLEQRLGSIPLAHLADRVRALITHPALASALVPTLIRMQLARLLHLAYPKRPSGDALRRWDRVATRIVGA